MTLVASRGTVAPLPLASEQGRQRGGGKEGDERRRGAAEGKEKVEGKGRGSGRERKEMEEEAKAEEKEEEEEEDFPCWCHVGARSVLGQRHARAMLVPSGTAPLTWHRNGPDMAASWK